jgi:hypothetical protein
MLCNISEVERSSYCGPSAQANCEIVTLSHYVLFFQGVFTQRESLKIFTKVAIKWLAHVIHIYVVPGSILWKLSRLNSLWFVSLRINSEIDWYIKQATTATFSFFVFFASFLLVGVDGRNVNTNVSERIFLPCALKFIIKFKNSFLWELKMNFWHL